MGFSTPATVGTGPTTITDPMWNELVNDLIDLKGQDSGTAQNADSVTLTNGMVCSLDSSGHLLRSTSAGQAGPLVVVQEQLVGGSSTGIAAAASGFYCAAGKTTVKTTGAVAVGDLLQASGTVGVAQTGTTNAFAVAVTVASGGFCTALVFPWPLSLDAAAGTASLRTLGTGSTQAAAGNDSRFTNARTPSGSAGGHLAGTYPNPTIGVLPWARVTRSTAQSIPDSAWTALTFDTEIADTDTIHSTSSNTSRLTATTAGVYLIVGQLVFAANATGTRMAEVLLNGTTTIAYAQTQPSTSFTDRVQITTPYQLAAGDYVELRAFQSSGGALNVVSASAYSPVFSMLRQGA